MSSSRSGRSLTGQASFHAASAAGKQARLRFLTAEATTHAAAFHQHLVGVPAQHVRDHVLHLGRMLRRAPYVHAVVFLRHRVGDLAFQIKLFLTAQRHLAGFRMRRSGNALGRLTALQMHRREHGFASGARFFGREQRGQHFVFDVAEACRATSRVVRRRHHDEHRLADEVHRVSRQNRIVVDDRAAVIGARDIRRREHGHHARRRLHAVQAQVDDARMRLRAHAKRGVQRAGKLGDVVGVRGSARHVQMCRFMRTRDADHCTALVRNGRCNIGFCEQEGFGLLIHVLRPQ